MYSNRQDAEWEWYRAEAISHAFKQFALTGKIIIQRQFLLLLFSMFFDDMVAWCNSNPNFASYHVGKLGIFDRLRYLQYDNKLVLKNQDKTIGVVLLKDDGDCPRGSSFAICK